MSSYLIPFLFSLFVAFCFTPIIRFFAKKKQVLDIPDDVRKKHKKPTPLWGGLVIFCAFFAIIGYFSYTGELFGDFVRPEYILGMFIGGFILMLGGILDDKYNLKPKYQIIFPVLAALAIVFSGIAITHIRSPFGGAIRFDIFNFTILSRELIFPGSFLTFLWLLGMMYTTKFLDGLDGLVTGITAIGAFVIFLVCLLPFVRQFDTALIAIIFTGVLMGFLPWNFHPARIFLGEGGSVFAGFILATLAVISGSKVATTLLVMGIPILDVLWIIARRVFWEKKSPAVGDRKHLHFRLLDIGLSHRQVVFLLYLFAILFGGISLLLQTKEKAIALSFLFILMVVVAFIVVKLYKKKNIV
ncbi:MAG: undecaprenyl/decaprenyl-phosphate alpha-N-acetylglucosaminyl 1-phosphate transferase [Parcubacteria group bacterium]|nr:undecaprenyl/decaprenyl-phosphate alpha-N-acetylglucosaminyl 1-phosphate transferase [Parcubacteria group bacterium]